MARREGSRRACCDIAVRGGGTAALRRIGRVRLYEDGGIAVVGLAWDGGIDCWARTCGGPKH